MEGVETGVVAQWDPPSANMIRVGPEEIADRADFIPQVFCARRLETDIFLAGFYHRERVAITARPEAVPLCAEHKTCGSPSTPRG